MQRSRLSLALDTGALALPEGGTVAVLRPRAGADLSMLPRDRVLVVQGFRPDHDAFAAEGYRTAVALDEPCSAAVVCLRRSKTDTRALVAAASRAVPAGGPIALDGLKTDGVDAVIREVRTRAQFGEAIAKAHGKIAVFANPGPEAFADWQGERPRTVEGHASHPAAFSADAVDPGSAALAAALPPRLPASVADLGAGWGYLAQAILAREGVREAHLVEAEHAALEAARLNVTDPRALFHWADATRFAPARPFGAVVTNPPFHAARAADPALGRAFIAAAARMLQPSGTLWLVANRHLPYERTLAETFREVTELPGPPAYKLFRATGPRRPGRRTG